MKKSIIHLSVLVLLMLFSNTIKAQQYCFWVANQTNQKFYELKIRETDSGNAFSDDLLPRNYIESGEHFWVRTNTGAQVWDVQITKMDGTPLLFTYQDVGGTWHKNQRFITVDAKMLHTLVIQENEDGSLSFAYYTTDQLDYGHPCDN